MDLGSNSGATAGPASVPREGLDWPTAEDSCAATFTRADVAQLLELVRARLPLRWTVDVMVEHDGKWDVWPRVVPPAGCGLPTFHLDRRNDGSVSVLTRNFIVEDYLMDELCDLHTGRAAKSIKQAVEWIAKDTYARLASWGLQPIQTVRQAA